MRVDETTLREQIQQARIRKWNVENPQGGVSSSNPGAGMRPSITLPSGRIIAPPRIEPMNRFVPVAPRRVIRPNGIPIPWRGFLSRGHMNHLPGQLLRRGLPTPAQDLREEQMMNPSGTPLRAMMPQRVPVIQQAQIGRAPPVPIDNRPCTKRRNLLRESLEKRRRTEGNTNYDTNY